jgi:putative acetyltransferase
LTVYVDNAPAIALYKRNGFEIEGTHREFAFRGGAFADAHAMARIKP